MSSACGLSCPPLAPPGEDAIIILQPKNINCRQNDTVSVVHGSSLSLIARASVVLNREFNDADPERDWEKWRELGARPYFFAALDIRDEPMCVLRVILDGDWSGRSRSGDGPGCSRRLIIDYLCTAKAHQGRGHASRLLDLAMSFACEYTANTFVLATEDSCPFWVSKRGFVLEEGAINQRLNVFSDTHLLKLPSNCSDIFDDPNVEGEELDSEDERGEIAEDDRAVQQALLQSLTATGGQSNFSQGHQEITQKEDDSRQISEIENDDHELAMALAMSLEASNR
eukprot:CAMPEP_0183307342 /NCGR_PEP_ID=MMETSP0160_2-20130417/17274_1 /TAXON_ID=2839 ORGANISM="Odontella Sinensis, Strain Grunow 1884" /NCGR_SAMPLE_ID=MMETSP0160_2 /ASSEMBLY_ACC=CAM_ASM_000250 /LENGTH=283 /DNA_ID=CAMNT_0025470907 /DNA_START=33 /DNA_END=884 /DNA_ORIENTATION=+